MVNLRAIANSVTKSINPNVATTLRRSIGSRKLPGGVRKPQFANAPITVQVQALSYQDLQQLEGLNIQGVRRAIYANGRLAGAIRVAKEGGDLLVFAPGTPGVPEGTTWLCVHVLEQWADWVKIVITLQNENQVVSSADASLDLSNPDNSQYVPGLLT